MRICLIIDNSETARHPVLAPTLLRVSARHQVELLDVRPLAAAEAIAQVQRSRPADLYLLKARASQGLDLARYLEGFGVPVLNRWASTAAALDRALTARRMSEASLPWPRTSSFPTLGALLADRELAPALSFPLVVKSQYSRRADLISRVDSIQQLQALGARWDEEPVVIQEFAFGDGWDMKVWVIDQEIFVARRRSSLNGNATEQSLRVATADLAPECTSIALAVGQVFDLRLYGVDLLMTAGGPIAVDINPFPGFREVPAAQDALLRLIERHERREGS